MESSVGRFCQSSANRFGIGRLVAVDGPTATIEYTDLPIQDYQYRFKVAAQTVKVGSLPVETRAYVPVDGYWIAGRVQGQVLDGYRILLPGNILADLDAADFEVRWNLPLSDPALALALKITGSPQFHRARLPFKELLLRQRGLVHGYTAVSSAGIELFPHQIDVAARVLTDPIMRYVLADEVGLGKTIEAGIVIRQLLLDDPRATVVVAAPETLVEQWRTELENKFYIDAIPPIGTVRVDVIPHQAIAPGARDSTPSLIVIDEAHQVTDPSSATYEDARQACEQAPAVLLLTATPLKGNAETFLRMLHIVDPVAYPRDSLPAFNARIEERQQDAYSVMSLDPGLPESVLRSLIEGIIARHGDDDELAERVSRVYGAMGADGAQLGEAIEALQLYLREAHRISRRVIRTRRGSMRGRLFPVRGRAVEIALFERAPDSDITRYLEEIRGQFQSIADGTSAFQEVVEAAFGGPTAFAAWVEQRIDLDETPWSALRPTLTGLRADLSFDTGRGVDAIVDRVANEVSHNASKVVVACSFSPSAKQLTIALRHRLGTPVVEAHTVDMTVGERDSAVGRFSGSATCRVLVMDSTGEEGRNLQVADLIVHADLPLSANRLEQRIGRADRYSKGRAVRNLVFVDMDSDYEAAWVQLLDQGVGVFDESVATLQRPLAELEAEVAGRLLDMGADAFRIDVDELRRRLDEERDRIDELEDIEASDQAVEFSLDAFDDLESFEANWGEVAEAFDRFTAAGHGGVRIRRRRRVTQPQIFEYTVDPNLQTIPMMRLDRLTKIGRLLPGQRTFSRDLALRNPGVRPVRVGDPLVDALEAYLSIDDRGRAWALWREVSGLGDRVMLFFRWDFEVSFDSRPVKEVIGDGADSIVNRVRRRGDAFLAPKLVTIWTNQDGVVPAPFVDRYLERPPRSAVDTHIAWREWDEVVRLFPDWAGTVHEARGRAFRAITRDPDFRSLIEQAVQVAERELAQRLGILETSVARQPEGPRKEREAMQLETERQLRTSVLSGLAEPVIDLYACGAVFLASQPLGKQ